MDVGMALANRVPAKLMMAQYGTDKLQDGTRYKQLVPVFDLDLIEDEAVKMVLGTYCIQGQRILACNTLHSSMQQQKEEKAAKKNDTAVVYGVMVLVLLSRWCRRCYKFEGVDDT